MSDLVGNLNCCFSHVKADIELTCLSREGNLAHMRFIIMICQSAVQHFYTYSPTCLKVKNHKNADP